MDKQKNALIKIDCKLIRELKSQGKRWEATQLIRKYQENILSNKEQTKKEIINKDRKIKSTINRKNGLCACGRKRYMKFVVCFFCLQGTRKYRRTHREQIRIRERKYYSLHKDKILQCKKEWYQRKKANG
jgi:hypothetical protein